MIYHNPTTFLVLRTSSKFRASKTQFMTPERKLKLQQHLILTHQYSASSLREEQNHTIRVGIAASITQDKAPVICMVHTRIIEKVDKSERGRGEVF